MKLKKKLTPNEIDVLKQFNKEFLQGDEDMKTIMMHPFVEMSNTELGEQVKEIKLRVMGV